jgi:hypothetical protein
MKDHLQRQYVGEGGAYLRASGTNPESTLNADRAVAAEYVSSPTAKRLAPQGTRSTPQSTLDAVALDRSLEGVLLGF